MFGILKRKKFDFQVATIEITNSCPCKCVGCYYYLEKGIKRGEIMDVVTFKRIMDNIPSVANLILSGGEPFVSKELKHICMLSAIKKPRPTILTSGSVLPDRNYLEDLSTYIGRVIVTVKYPDRAKDAKWKGIPEDKDYAFLLLEMLKELGIERGIHWTIDNKNKIYYEEMKRLAKHFKADLEMLRFLSFKNEFDHYQMTPDEFFKYRVYPDPYCPAGALRFSVGISGDVSPCIYSNHIVGNVLRDPWMTIQRKLYEWRESKGDEKYKCFADIHTL